MADVVTKVLYDTDPAVDELTKLDNKLRQSADSAEKSFDKMSKGSKLFEQGLSKVSGPAGDFIGKLRNLSAEYGTAGLAAGAVAVSLSAIAAELIDIPELTKDAAAATNALNAAIEQELELLNKLDDLSSARQFRGFTNQERELDQRRINIAERQNAIDEQREVLQTRLSSYRQYYDSIDRRAEESQRTRENLERRLSGLRESAEVSSVSNLPIGRQVLELINLSQRSSRTGDLEKAERLLDKAKEVASRTGDQSGFFSRQIGAAESNLVSQIEKQINARKREEEAIKAQKKAAEELIRVTEGQDSVLKAEQRGLRRESRDVRRDSREIQLTRAIAQDEDKADDAARSRAAAHQQIINLLNTERSLLQQVTDIGKTAGTVFFGAGASGLTKQIEDVKQTQDLFLRASSRLSNRTTQDDEAGAQDLVKVQQLLGKLQELRAGGGLSGALEFNVQNLEKAVEAYGKILDADKLLEQSGKSTFKKEDEGGLLRGTEEAEDKLSNARLEAERLRDALQTAADASIRINPSIPSAPANAASPAPANAASPAVTAVTQQTINVNAEVKGGIIDPETTRIIVGLIQRELRRGTGPQTG